MKVNIESLFEVPIVSGNIFPGYLKYDSKEFVEQIGNEKNEDGSTNDKWFEYFALKKHFDDLKNNCIEMREHERYENDSAHGTYNDCILDPDKYPEDKNFLDIIEKKYSIMSELIPYNLYGAKHHIIFSLPGESTVYHNHSFDKQGKIIPDYICTLYLNCSPNHGILKFIFNVSGKMYTKSYSNDTGDFLIFPGNIPHLVTKNESDSPRIVLTSSFTRYPPETLKEMMKTFEGDDDE